MGIISRLNWSEQERKASWKRRAWGTENLSGGSEVCKEDKVSRKTLDRKVAFLGQRSWKQAPDRE